MSGDIPELRRNQQAGGDSDEDIDVSGDPDATMYAYAFQDFESGRPTRNNVQPGRPDGPGTSNAYSLESSMADLSRRPFDLEEYYNDALDHGVEVDFLVGRSVYGIEGMQGRPGTSRRRICTRRERRRLVASQPDLVRVSVQNQSRSQPWSTSIQRKTSQAQGSEDKNVSGEDKKLVGAKRYYTCGTHIMTWPPPPPPPPSGQV